MANKLLGIGAEYVSYGQFDHGISLIQNAIKRDQLRHPEDAKLMLGLAYLKAGKKPQAVQTLKTVGGTEGAADIAKALGALRYDYEVAGKHLLF